jgi:membrane protease YdiL (CAAX protease family)
VEEALFRGYAITRLEALTRSSVFAATFSVLIFALAHWPVWGPGPVVTFILSGGFLAARFVWLRDLLANIVAHVAVDFAGLVFAPPSP